jgi:uncharacterized protein (DUF1501 family)
MKTSRLDLTRRQFLKRGALLPAIGTAAPWLLNLAASSGAMAATMNDYKALVCVFLYGGNDYANTVVPYDDVSHTAYQTLRPAFAYSRDALSATALNAPSYPQDSQGVAHQYALAPELAPLSPLFQSGSMAVLLNVGTLIQPTSKAQYQAGSMPLPAKLFSHNDQQSEWQSSGSEGTTTGWGGRFEDVLELNNAYPAFSAINVYANAVYLAGDATTQYQVTANGPVPLTAITNLYGSATAAKALQAVITGGSRQLFESDYAAMTLDALTSYQTLASALATAPPIQTAFPGGNGLADQLKMVAKIASVAKNLGIKRQVFFVALGGFDTHDTLATTHPRLLTQVGGALSAFHDATAELGLAANITTFTASEFGRTLTVNADGSDHGWGSMHFIIGGAVRGQRYYGVPPVVANNGPDDVGQGRLLPTTSVDQYAATLGRWFGLSDADLLTALPNLGNFPPASRNLGFV